MCFIWVDLNIAIVLWCWFGPEQTNFENTLSPWQGSSSINTYNSHNAAIAMQQHLLLDPPCLVNAHIFQSPFWLNFEIWCLIQSTEDIMKLFHNWVVPNITAKLINWWNASLNVNFQNYERHKQISIHPPFYCGGRILYISKPGPIKPKLSVFIGTTRDTWENM